MLVLFSEVTSYLLTSSEREKFVNLKEVFKNGVEHINRNLNSTIKRVLADTRETTVIDRLLRRIEEIADDDSIKLYGLELSSMEEKQIFLQLLINFLKRGSQQMKKLKKPFR